MVPCVRRGRRPDNFYELLTCGWQGHALVGTDAAEVTPEDALVVRESDGDPMVPVPAL